MKLKHIIYGGALLICAALNAAVPNNVAEEVVWMIGDQPIWKSEVEETYSQMLQEKHQIKGDPYCYVPEQIALERIYLHQADLDTIEASASTIASEVDSRINDWIISAGSREKLEEYIHKSLPEIRVWLTEAMTNNYRVEQVKRNLTESVKSTPMAVRRYFSKLPEDSIPFVPTQVEVQIMTLKPTISQQAIDDVKDRLRSYADRVNSGSADFSTLAVLYSEDASSTYGGEIGFRPRSGLVKEYAATAFNLTDPKKASKVVETEYGYHIIQLIEKRGDRINTRHILLRPKVDDSALTEATTRLDSVRARIIAGTFTFDDATALISQDKDTKNNHGVMTNSATGTTFFEMSQLPQDVAKVVAGLKVGEVSNAFVMKDNTGMDVVAIVKLRNRVDAHRANMADDYQTIKDMYEAAESQRVLAEWINKKISDTYIRIEPGWSDCPDFQFNWLKK